MIYSSINIDRNGLEQQPDINLELYIACNSSQTIQTLSNPLKLKRGKSNLDNNNVSDSVTAKHKFKDRFTKLKILWEEQVGYAIATYTASQINAVIKHIENTWDMIKHPKSVFLYKLRRQKKEELEARNKVKTAKDFTGWTLNKLPKMYPIKWRETVVHFRVSLEGSHEPA